MAQQSNPEPFTTYSVPLTTTGDAYGAKNPTFADQRGDQVAPPKPQSSANASMRVVFEYVYTTPLAITGDVLIAPAPIFTVHSRDPSSALIAYILPSDPLTYTTPFATAGDVVTANRTGADHSVSPVWLSRA